MVEIGPAQAIEIREPLKESRFALVFPGQGSQVPGMGYDLFEGSAAAREVFQEADDILDANFSGLMFRGSEDELRKTVNAQPAILIHSVAAMRAFEEALGGKRFMPRETAGHSVGEYAALVASGALSFREALPLVRERGRLMQEAGKLQEGSMAAILGLDMQSTEQLCQQTGAEIANDNCDGQIVISGSRQALMAAIDLSKALGAKRAIPLDVSGAFHSKLMGSAIPGMREALRKAQFQDPKAPIISNITAEPLSKAEEFPGELIAQICGSVQWRKSVRYMFNSGISVFLELGPGSVLTNFVKRIDGINAKGMSLGSLAAIRSFAS